MYIHVFLKKYKFGIQNTNLDLQNFELEFINTKLTPNSVENVTRH